MWTNDTVSAVGPILMEYGLVFSNLNRKVDDMMKLLGNCIFSNPMEERNDAETNPTFSFFEAVSMMPYCVRHSVSTAFLISGGIVDEDTMRREIDSCFCTITRVFQLLLSTGADVDMTTDGADALLHIIVELHIKGYERYMLRVTSGSEYFYSCNSRTPKLTDDMIDIRISKSLINSVVTGIKALIRLLVDSCANVNAQNQYGDIALHKLMKLNNRRAETNDAPIPLLQLRDSSVNVLAESFLNAGIDVSITNNDGHNILALQSSMDTSTHLYQYLSNP